MHTQNNGFTSRISSRCGDLRRALETETSNVVKGELRFYRKTASELIAVIGFYSASDVAELGHA